MIKTYADYKHYCKVDAEANNYKGKHPRLIGNEIWKFLVALRRYEYVKNCINGGLKRILLPLAKFRWHMLSVKTGILIYPNTFEEGLTLWHYGCIVSHNTVRGGQTSYNSMWGKYCGECSNWK